jgi:ATP-dependent protease ClpP protease subunit
MPIEIKMSATGAKEDAADIFVYGELTDYEIKDWWTGETVENTISQYAIFKELDKLKDAKKITLHINSIGGSAYAGIAINTRLRMLSAHKTAIVEGIAASVATLIMLAGDEIKIPAGAGIMIHDPLVSLRGFYSLADMEKAVTAMQTMKKQAAAIYSEKTGKSEDEISRLMTAETWYTGTEAVKEGFATELLFEPVQMCLSSDHHLSVNTETFDIHGYKNIPIPVKDYGDAGRMKPALPVIIKEMRQILLQRGGDKNA